MEKIFISARLIGQKVRYHGDDTFFNYPIFEKWIFEGSIISICPEISANLSIPRLSSEIIAGNGVDVLKGKAKVLTNTGINRTKGFIQGAKTKALALTQKYNIKIAVFSEYELMFVNNYLRRLEHSLEINQ